MSESPVAPPAARPRPRVYLAGPDVFYPDALQRGQRMKALCAQRGWDGLFPLDATLDPALAPSRAIFEANRQFIQQADAVVANLRDFRGFEPDSGTVWEVSFALALGKPVVGYLPGPDSLLARMAGHAHGGRDREGCAVEDFGLPLNLMLAHSLHALVHGPEDGLRGLQAALDALAAWLTGGSASSMAQAVPA